MHGNSGNHYWGFHRCSWSKVSNLAYDISLGLHFLAGCEKRVMYCARKDYFTGYLLKKWRTTIIKTQPPHIFLIKIREQTKLFVKSIKLNLNFTPFELQGSPLVYYHIST